MLQPTILADHESMSAAAADWLAARIASDPALLLCLATGSTPLRAYQLLAARARVDTAAFEHVRVLKLDEWGGIPMDRPATCETFLRENLVEPLGLGTRYFGFESQPADPKAECQRVQWWMAANGPIDVLVLGLGLNGHLGFNEPAKALQPHAHVATLSQESLSHSMIATEPVKPTFGLTLGMADILQARRILLVVSGAAKRSVLGKVLEGKVSTTLPASFLCLHPDVTILCDKAAAGE